jgi:GNAT superfamily N-acetyltransferase
MVVDRSRSGVDQAVPPATLVEHLDSMLGAWPPTGPLDIVASARRELPGWDGIVCPALGLTAAGGTVLSVPPDQVARVAAAARENGAAALLRDVGGAVGRRSLRTVPLVFRWCTDPAPLPEVGSWLPAADPRVPRWLRPFGGEVLVAVDDAGEHLGGVGVKRHHGNGAELAVVTARHARSQWLGRRLVAQAARRILDEGSVPTYLHLPDNVPSARLAGAVGFLDPGWTMVAALPQLSFRARLQKLARRR